MEDVVQIGSIVELMDEENNLVLGGIDDQNCCTFIKVIVSFIVFRVI